MQMSKELSAKGKVLPLNTSQVILVPDRCITSTPWMVTSGRICATKLAIVPSPQPTSSIEECSGIRAANISESTRTRRENTKLSCQRLICDKAQEFATDTIGYLTS